VTKHLTHETSYDAPLAAVAAMIADPAYREEVSQAQGSTRTTVQIEGSGAGMSVLVDQLLPAEGLPGFARKLVGDQIHIVAREDWAALDSADLHVTIPGKPGEMTGSVLLAETDGSTTYTAEVAIKVHIPLVGGKVESLIADMLRKALNAEGAVARDYLSR
jgi:Protein of unknown function (DUF2505)